VYYNYSYNISNKIHYKTIQDWSIKLEPGVTISDPRIQFKRKQYYKRTFKNNIK